MKIKLCILLAVMLFCSPLLYARGHRHNENHCARGNLALPGIQQPGPLIAFGENILDQGQIQLSFGGDLYKGKNQYFIDLAPSILYGITDEFSLYIQPAYAVRYKDSEDRSSGPEDTFVQFEYAFFDKSYDCFDREATIVFNVSLPTGSSHKHPNTGFGALSYFIGATYNYTGIYWLWFTSYGAQLTTSHHHTRFGNQYFYQWGIGRNIANVKQWIFAWVLEVDGIFASHDRVCGDIDCDSGGNVIFVTPSLSVSSEHFVIQVGPGYTVQQHLFGTQNRSEYQINFSLSWTF